MNERKLNLIIFGAGNAGKAFISNLDRSDSVYNILAIADNDIKKHNTLFQGYPVIPPEEISQFKYDKIVIASMYTHDIIQQLTNDLGIKSYNLIIPSKSMIVPGKSHRPFEDKKTLELARNTLLCITNILRHNNINYFIDHGTLLGIVRDGDIIPWDDDIDISVNKDDMRKTAIHIKNNIMKMPMNEKLGWEFSISPEDNDMPNVIKIGFDSYNKLAINKFSISIVSVNFQGGFAVQSITYSPEYHFRKWEFVNYRGQNLRVPYDYEKYLEFHYGDWMVPKKDISWLDIKNHKIKVIK